MKPYSWALIAVLCLFLSCQHPEKAAREEVLTYSADTAKQMPGENKLIDNQTLSGIIAGTDSSGPSATPVSPAKNTAAKTFEDWDRKIIRNADLQLELKNYQVYDRSYRTAIRNLGGYIAREEQRQSDERIENSVSIRVPVAAFEEAISLLTPSSEKLIEKKVSSEDVGNQIVDTRSRMEARRHIRDRYLEMLKQAKNMEEVMLVQNEINQQQESIETAAGRVNYLSHAAAYSTINLTYYQLLTVPPAEKEPGYGARFLDALKNGWSVVAGIGLALANIWPLLALIFAGWIVYRRTNKKSTLPVSTK